MFALIAVGVGSAALFTGSACDDLEPVSVPSPVSSTDVREVVDDLFEDEEASARMVDAVSELATVLGPVTGAASTPQAEQLSVSRAGAIAIGDTVTALSEDGAEVRAAVGLPAATTVGSGDLHFALALVNDLTGQVDALQPLDLSLQPAAGCLDTATVNVPFAFYLDARDGELLVFRVEEDSDEPQLELRGGDGARWQADLDLAVAPPGLLGERLSGRLGDEQVVVARRVVPGETQPAVTAVTRADGEMLWTVAGDDLLIEGEPTWIEVLVVDAASNSVVLALGEDDDLDRTRLVGLDAADGSVRWRDEDTEGAGELLTGDGVALRIGSGGAEGQRAVEELDVRTGERRELGALGSASAVRGSSTDERSLVALGEGGLLVVAGRELQHLPLEPDVLDVAVHDGGTSVLLGERDDLITVTFGTS